MNYKSSIPAQLMRVSRKLPGRRSTPAGVVVVLRDESLLTTPGPPGSMLLGAVSLPLPKMEVSLGATKLLCREVKSLLNDLGSISAGVPVLFDPPNVPVPC